MENKKPTLEEVKEYFKNAKEVMCLANNYIFEIDFRTLNKKNNNGTDNYWCLSKNGSWILLWSFLPQNYAEIISYKEETPENIGQIKKDSIVESVINQFKERSEAGIKKYNTTLDRTDLNTLDWINHAQQEAMDFVLYLEKLKKEYEVKN